MVLLFRIYLIRCNTIASSSLILMLMRPQAGGEADAQKPNPKAPPEIKRYEDEFEFEKQRIKVMSLASRFFMGAV